MTDTRLADSIVALRPFVPALSLRRSMDFYAALGFDIHELGDAVAHVALGRFAFLLQAFDRKEFAENFMMHLLVRDLDAWWRHIAALDLEGRFGVAAPKAPRLEPWGLRVAYVFDPSGVLWHIAEESAAGRPSAIRRWTSATGAKSFATTRSSPPQSPKRCSVPYRDGGSQSSNILR